MGNRVLGQALYVIFGIIYLAAGTSVLLIKTGTLPSALVYIVTEATHHDPHTLHVAQEFGTHLVILGLVTLWFVRHYDQSQVFHWAMTLGWGLFALIHWADVRGTSESIKGPALNTVPFVLFAIVGVLRRRGA